MMNAWVYILECADGSYYTGWTNNVEKRFQAHCTGRGAKYTRAHPPLKIVYVKGFEDKSAAMKHEAAIKRLTRAQKTALIAETAPGKNEKDDSQCRFLRLGSLFFKGGGRKHGRICKSI